MFCTCEILIYILYISNRMRKISIVYENKITVTNIRGYFEKTVTKFGTGAKADIPKEYLGKRVIILVCEN